MKIMLKMMRNVLKQFKARQIPMGSGQTEENSRSCGDVGPAIIQGWRDPRTQQAINPMAGSPDSLRY